MTGLLFRLLGQRIAYSASPAMMAAAFDALGLPHRYELADVDTTALPGVVRSLRDRRSGGANVTTPHKPVVAGLVDRLDPGAERTRSVNTIVRDDERLVGHDTDQPAIRDAIAALRPDGVQRAVVLGSGGAARAARTALEGLGAATTIVSRSGEDPGWDALPTLLQDADIVVNATPVGTTADDSPVPAGLHRAGLAVLDLVYRPSPTRLVRDARAAGADATAGAGVLLGQGRRSVELWLGVPAPIDAMRDALRGELGPGADV